MKYIFILIMIIFSLDIFSQSNSVDYQIINGKKVYNTYTLSGPRIGGTLIGNGKLVNDIKNEFKLEKFNRFVVQLGWQEEFNFFTLSNGASGVAQVIGLVGGLDQSIFLPSVSGLMGFRSGSGFEFGVGGNLSLSGVGLVLAVGYNFESEKIRFPINFALVPSKDGLRATLVFGFSLRN